MNRIMKLFTVYRFTPAIYRNDWFTRLQRCSHFCSCFYDIIFFLIFSISKYIRLMQLINRLMIKHCRIFRTKHWGKNRKVIFTLNWIKNIKKTINTMIWNRTLSYYNMWHIVITLCYKFTDSLYSLYYMFLLDRWNENGFR